MKKAEYQVIIESCDNGLIVRVGCKTLVVLEGQIDDAFDDIKKLMTGGWEGQKEVRKKWLNDLEVEECAPTCEPALAQGTPR